MARARSLAEFQKSFPDEESCAAQAKPRRKRAKYLDTRSCRLRLAVIANNSAASIEAFVRANVKPGTTLLTDGHASYPGLSGYRHDPRVVGTMAGHVVLPWSHRAFSLLKRWALGTYHGLRRKHVDTYLNEFVFRYFVTIVASINQSINIPTFFS